MGGIRDKLPLYKKHKPLFTILAVMLTYLMMGIIGTFSFDIINSLYSEQYRKELIVEKEQEEKRKVTQEEQEEKRKVTQEELEEKRKATEKRGDEEQKIAEKTKEVIKKNTEKKNQKIESNENEKEVASSINKISGLFSVDVQNGLLYGDMKKLCIVDKKGNMVQSYFDEGYMISQAGTIIGPTEIETHLYKLEEKTNKIIFNTNLTCGYINITSIAENIIENSENIIGQKVAFCGLGIYHDFNKIELSYFEGENRDTLVTAYFDTNKISTMGDVEPLYMANTIVWGTVKKISKVQGIEMSLDAVNVTKQDLWFPEFYAYEYQEMFNANEASVADFGEKLTMEGIVEATSGKAHNLILDDGSSCELWGGMSEDLSSVGCNAIYDSFNGLRVKVYGKLVSGKPMISVDYIEPIAQ